MDFTWCSKPKWVARRTSHRIIEIAVFSVVRVFVNQYVWSTSVGKFTIPKPCKFRSSATIVIALSFPNNNNVFTCNTYIPFCWVGRVGKSESVFIVKCWANTPVLIFGTIATWISWDDLRSTTTRRIINWYSYIVLSVNTQGMRSNNCCYNQWW